MNLRECAGSMLRDALRVVETSSGDDFSYIAQEVLTDFPMVSTSDFFDFLESEAASGRIVQRHNPRFGQPSVILAQEENHFVEMLLWRDDVTSIHEHSFSGAFKALDGRRVHTQFNFAPDHEYHTGNDVETGELRIKELELMHPGDIRRIVPFRSYIHMLWTIDRPGLTVVLRENGKKSSKSYVPPGIAFDEFAGEHELTPYILVLETLYDNNRDRWMALVEHLVSTLTLNGIIYFLLLSGDSSVNSKVWLRMLDILSVRFPVDFKLIVKMVNLDRSLRYIASLRRVATSSRELGVLFKLYATALSHPDLEIKAQPLLQF